MPKRNRVTRKAVLAVLRHHFTNYDELRESGLYEYSELKNTTHEFILERIGGWDSGKERRRKR